MVTHESSEDEFRAKNSPNNCFISRFICIRINSSQTDNSVFLLSYWPFSRIIHLQNPSKLTEKQMDKVDRRIVHPNVRPFHFQIKTYYLSMDAKYPTDNPSQTENNVNTAIKNLEQ